MRSNANMRRKCEPTTIKKLDELQADVNQKQLRSEAKGGAKAPKDDSEAAERFKKKLMSHRCVLICMQCRCMQWR